MNKEELGLSSNKTELKNLITGGNELDSISLAFIRNDKSQNP